MHAPPLAARRQGRNEPTGRSKLPTISLRKRKSGPRGSLFLGAQSQDQTVLLVKTLRPLWAPYGSMPANWRDFLEAHPLSRRVARADRYF